jgi:hypothetical protein
MSEFGYQPGVEMSGKPPVLVSARYDSLLNYERRFQHLIKRVILLRWIFVGLIIGTKELQGKEQGGRMGKEPGRRSSLGSETRLAEPREVPPNIVCEQLRGGRVYLGIFGVKFHPRVAI